MPHVLDEAIKQMLDADDVPGDEIAWRVRDYERKLWQAVVTARGTLTMDWGEGSLVFAPIVPLEKRPDSEWHCSASLGKLKSVGLRQHGDGKGSWTCSIGTCHRYMTETRDTAQGAVSRLHEVLVGYRDELAVLVGP